MPPGRPGRQRDVAFGLDRLVHAYFDINPDILWDTVLLALPGLLTQLRGPLEKD